MRSILKRIISPFLKKASATYLTKPRKYSYKDISVLVVPTVFPPFITISTKLLLEFCATLSLKDKTFLELGCGCGIISILAAKKGATVTSTDINQAALDALKQNASNNNVSIDILYSDLFENLRGKSFDFIIINPPYYPQNPDTIAEKAWFCGLEFEYFERLFLQLGQYLLGNQIFMILSEDCNIARITAIASKSGIKYILMSEEKVAGEKNYIFRLAISN